MKNKCFLLRVSKLPGISMTTNLMMVKSKMSPSQEQSSTLSSLHLQDSQGQSLSAEWFWSTSAALPRCDVNQQWHPGLIFPSEKANSSKPLSKCEDGAHVK